MPTLRLLEEMSLTTQRLFSPLKERLSGLAKPGFGPPAAKTSNGVIGVHFIPHSIDHGISEVPAASVLAVMGP